jgi:sensor domain CHASE-containing protein
MTANGIDVLVAVAVLALVFCAWTWVEWLAYDRQRRQQRVVHRNLLKQSGEWPS